MAKNKKDEPKKRAEKYDDKLVVNASFEDIIKMSVNVDKKKDTNTNK